MQNWQINKPNRQAYNSWSNFPHEIVNVILVNAINPLEHAAET